MTEIESRLGKSSFDAGSSKVSPRKVYQVADESGMATERFTPTTQRREPRGYHKLSPEEVSMLEDRRTEAALAQERISPDARSRIEFLTGIGRIVDSVTVENVKFYFQSLKAREQEEVFDTLKDLDSMTPLKLQFEVRSQTLSRSLTHINDNKIGLVVGTEDPDTIIELVIKELDENIVDYLYKWYQENIVKVGQEKYSLETKAEVQEVAEEVKK